MNKNIIKAWKSRKICFARELNVDYLWNIDLIYIKYFPFLHLFKLLLLHMFLLCHELLVLFLPPGRVAALNMLNKPTTIESVPFFWSALAGKSIRYAGRVFNTKSQNPFLVHNKLNLISISLLLVLFRLWWGLHRNHN